MIPQLLSHTHERGYYIVWDTNNWRKERVSRDRTARHVICGPFGLWANQMQRELTLHYADLDATHSAA